MKLWLLRQDTNQGYDTYDSCVVAAKTEEEARQINPDGDGIHYRAWVTPTEVTVELLGTAKPGTRAGVICSSFNAG